MNLEPRSDEVVIKARIRALLGYRYRILIAVLLVTALSAVGAGSYLLVLQPSRKAAELEFRPVFAGADKGRYPNGLNFGGSDIIAGSVINVVYEKNRIADFCGYDDFRAGFAVVEGSKDHAVVDFEFQARLSDARLSMVERERLQNEYRARRASLPVHYRVLFVWPAGCDRLPTEFGPKIMGELLATWAQQSEDQRGVLKVRVPVLTPHALKVRAAGDSTLVRADLLRSVFMRIFENIREVEAIGGTEGVRLEDGRSLLELRLALQEIMQSQLDTLIVAAGRDSGRDALVWVEERLQQARTRRAAAESHARAASDGLREYEGRRAGVTPAPSPGNVNPSTQVQGFLPQIDRSFVEWVVELSAGDASFRQNLTTQMVEASKTAVDASRDVQHYERLLQLLRGGGERSLPHAEIKERLDLIVADATSLVQDFNKLYDEFSRVALRIGPAMYQVVAPTVVNVIRPFSRSDFIKLMLIVIAVSLLVSVLTAFVHLLYFEPSGPVQSPAVPQAPRAEHTGTAAPVTAPVTEA